MNVTSKTQSQESLRSAAEDAAETVGVRVYNLRESGKGIAFTLKTEGSRPKYRRFSQFGRTAPGRVCWHGTRDFLRVLFTRVPDAKIRTAMATYNGASDFEQTYGKTFYTQSQYMGFYMKAPNDQDCACAE